MMIVKILYVVNFKAIMYFVLAVYKQYIWGRLEAEVGNKSTCISEHQASNHK